MKLYKYTCGDHEAYGVADNDQDAYERRADVDSTFHYIPVTVEEVKLDGYEITVTAASSDLSTMNRDALKQHLKAKGIEFTPQWGEDKLREVALANA